MATACRRRRSGNTPVAPEATRPMASVMARRTCRALPGSRGIPAVSPERWERSCPTAGDSSTCTAMCGNGATTITARPPINRKRERIRAVRPRARSASCAAGPGTARPRSVAPPIVSTNSLSIPMPVSALTAMASAARAMPLLLQRQQPLSSAGPPGRPPRQRKRRLGPVPRSSRCRDKARSIFLS